MGRVSGSLVLVTFAMLLGMPLGLSYRTGRAEATQAEPELAQEDAIVDIRQDGGPVRRGIPSKPADWQKRPPCPKEMGEREIKGACYFRIHPEDMRPPCTAPALEDGEYCWRAIAQPQREPASMGR